VYRDGKVVYTHDHWSGLIAYRRINNLRVVTAYWHRFRGEKFVLSTYWSDDSHATFFFDSAAHLQAFINVAEGYSGVTREI